MLELSKGILATEDGLGIYLTEINTLVYADLHIGLEFSLFNQGTYLPVDQFQIMKDQIFSQVKRFKPGTLVINGDFKHEFSSASPQEWFELDILINELNEYDLDLQIVRGNHDNYLKNILKRYNKSLNEPNLEVDGYLFSHGHLDIDYMFQKEEPTVDWLILGHEHPVIALYDDLSGKHKFRCYLLGNFKDYNILVLPALTPMASGTVINSSEANKLLSPILNELTLDNFQPIVVDKGEKLIFPKIKEFNNLHDGEKI